MIENTSKTIRYFITNQVIKQKFKNSNDLPPPPLDKFLRAPLLTTKLCLNIV